MTLRFLTPRQDESHKATGTSRLSMITGKCHKYVKTKADLHLIRENRLSMSLVTSNLQSSVLIDLLIWV